MSVACQVKVSIIGQYFDRRNTTECVCVCVYVCVCVCVNEYD